MGTAWCLFYSLAVVLLINYSLGAPRGSSKTKTNYDQKQTGDYNIRLNLKDFQIVAIVDDSLGDLGSYDYNYDYSELTVKPGSVSTPASTEQSSTIKEEVTTKSPTSKPESAYTTENKPDADSNITVIQVLSPHESVNPVSVDAANPTTQKTVSSTETAASSVSSTENDPATTQKVIQEYPDKIPVFVQPVGYLKDGLNEKKGESSATSVSIVPVEDLGLENSTSRTPLGEIMYYRKCAQGYARDKRGRCRKIRRPQFPFGIARLASNLAAKFRPVALDENGSSTPESDD